MSKILELLNNNYLFDVINSISSVILALIALYFTIKTYGLKKGQNIRGSYSTSQSIYCEDTYIHTVELENYKDKVAIIYSIYLKIGHNYYLELENFEDSPLMLNPFELYKKEYDPIDLYMISFTHVSIEKLLLDKKVKKQLVLSTSKGKYKVRKRINHWSPIYYQFKNYSRSMICIGRTSYNNKSYGGNATYI
nr:hypothetical protein [Turicibacter sp.]